MVAMRAKKVHKGCIHEKECILMSAVMSPMGSLAEAFREPDHAYLSPKRVGAALGLQIQSLAARPQNESLQHYLREVVRVLAAAEDAAGGDRSRAIFWFMNEPLQDFDYQTPDALIRAGKSQVVVDYIESIAGGATG
jgi:hypothetical protein